MDPENAHFGHFDGVTVDGIVASCWLNHPLDLPRTGIVPSAFTLAYMKLPKWLVDMNPQV